jgi:putative CocE/NonD family hydrolase
MVMESSSVRLGDGDLGPDSTVDHDVMVEMRDGVRIACDVYRPKAPGRYPVLYAVSPYLKDSVYLPTLSVYRYRETGNIAKWVSRGYVYVHADARGSGQSDGSYELFSAAERHDLYDMIEWCAAQPWSTGKVGMIGESYYGMVQWQAAAQNPPHLACVAPYDACTDLYRQFAYKGAVYSTGFQNHWYSNSVRNRAFFDYPERPKRDDYLSHDYLLDNARHPTFDEYWEGRRADLSAIRVPVFSIGNWAGTNAHLLGNLQGFMQAQGPKKLLINVGDPQLLFLDPQIEEQLARWYDHWLKGADNGVMDEPPVRIYIRNGAGYRDEQEWPLRRAEPRKLYLAPGPSGAAGSLNDGKLTWLPPGAGPPPTSYTYPDRAWTFPGTGTSVRGKMGLPHTTRKILTFTSDPFTADTEVTGPVVLNLWAASSARDTQFIVKIMDLAPLTAEVAQAIEVLDVAAPSQQVTEGWLRASHRALDPRRSTELSPYHSHVSPEPLEPGTIYQFAIEIWPTCWVFQKGHRLRLDLAALDQQGQYYLGHLRATDTFYHDPGHPSHLILPVIPPASPAPSAR